MENDQDTWWMMISIGGRSSRECVEQYLTPSILTITLAITEFNGNVKDNGVKVRGKVENG